MRDREVDYDLIKNFSWELFCATMLLFLPLEKFPTGLFAAFMETF